MPDVIGFFRSGLNTDYLFAQSGTFDTQADVNQKQQEMVQRQKAAGTLTDLEANAQIAELQGNTLGEVAKTTGRPTDEFVSEATKNLEEIARRPLNIIPTQYYVIGAVVLIVYIELTTGIFTSLLRKKASSV